MTLLTLETGAKNVSPRENKLATMHNIIFQGRNGKGNIYVWAAGNGGDVFDSCAADGYISSINTIGVGAADESSNQAYYDEECASKMVVTFNHNSRTSSEQVVAYSPNIIAWIKIISQPFRQLLV